MKKKRPFIWGSAFNNGYKTATIVNELSSKYGTKIKHFIDGELQHSKDNTVTFDSNFYNRGEKQGIKRTDLMQLKAAIKDMGRLIGNKAYFNKASRQESQNKKKQSNKWSSPFRKFIKKEE